MDVKGKKTKKRATAKKKGASEIKIGEKFKKELPVKINEKACERKRIRVIKAMTERNVEIEKMKPFRLKAKTLAEEINKLHDEIEASVEDRPVDCQVEYDYQHRAVRTRRLDTNQFVKDLERTMTDEDREEELDFPKAGKKGAKEVEEDPNQRFMREQAEAEREAKEEENQDPDPAEDGEDEIH